MATNFEKQLQSKYFYRVQKIANIHIYVSRFELVWVVLIAVKDKNLAITLFHVIKMA